MPNDLSDSLLVDTNVLIYSINDESRTKQQVGSSLLGAAVRSRRGVVTSQILAEFVAVTTSKRKRTNAILSAAGARNWVGIILGQFMFVEITAPMLSEATRGMVDHHMHIFDAQIWAAAKLLQIETIVTEDMPSRAVIEGVRYVNPFAPGFELSQLGL